MQDKPLFEYIFSILDYGDRLADMIDLSNPENIDNGNYFMTLVYIEDMLDKYARGLVLHSAQDAGLDGKEMLDKARARMDELRGKIRKLAQEGDFDEILQHRGMQMFNDWHKLSPDHPNLQVSQ